MIWAMVMCRVYEENDTIRVNSKKKEKTKVFVSVSCSHLFKLYLVLLALQTHTINSHCHHHEKVRSYAARREYITDFLFLSFRTQNSFFYGFWT